MQEAEDTAQRYLEVGAPFYGECSWDDKAAVKEAGATWRPNPEKQKGVRDGRPGGWWVAKDEAVLLDLLQLPAVPHRLWTPIAFNDTAVSALRSLLFARKQAAEEADREARRAKPKAESDKQVRQWLGIGDDTDAQIMLLSDALGVPMVEVPPIVAKAIPWMKLGPRSGMSDAQRLLRGLHLGLLCPTEARNGGPKESEPPRRRTQRAARARQRPLGRPPPSEPCADAADAAAFDGALLSWDDNEWLGPDPAPSYSGGYDTPTCPKCHELVWVQFGGSCGCRSV